MKSQPACSSLLERPTSCSTCSAESVEGELYLGVKEVENGPALQNSRHGASATNVPQDVHASTGPTSPGAEGSQASGGESVGEKNSTDDGNLKEKAATDMMPAPQGKAGESATGGVITRLDSRKSITEYIKKP
jgi:hypothetical protein